MTKAPGPSIAMYRPDLRDLPSAPLPAGFSLRPVASREEAELARLLSAAFGEPWDEARVRATLTRAPDVRAVYAVFGEGALVATASSQALPARDPGSGFVHWVATHPHHRGRRLGAALVGHLLRDFRGRGYGSARLFTQPHRLPAIATYLGCGFVPEYEVDGRDDRLTWSRTLQALMGRP